MDKLVRRVTVVQGGGEKAKVVYESKEDEDEPGFRPLERAVRHMLKADLIRAQEAYDRHVVSAAKGRGAWLVDAPSNMAEASRKAEKEARKASPNYDEDEDEGD